jgi:hypothetical protein
MQYGFTLHAFSCADFTNPSITQQRYMLISYTEFHPARSINVAGMVRNSFMFPQESMALAAPINVIQNSQFCSDISTISVQIGPKF